MEGTKQLPFRIMAAIVAIWVASDIGYYLLAWLLGSTNAYSNNPFVMAGYYLLWVAVALVAFWSLYKKWRIVEGDWSLAGPVVLACLLIAAYLAFILPVFPPIHWAAFWTPPPELLTASRWYFLPKSVEIVLQQLLLAALVLAFDLRGYTLPEIREWSAILFRSIHLLLVFGQSFSYVVVFTLAATAAGFVFPYLLLRVRNGFVYSYSLHWAFYAVIIVLDRVLYVH